jgi:hypothetical protein
VHGEFENAEEISDFAMHTTKAVSMRDPVAHSTKINRGTGDQVLAKDTQRMRSA